MMKNGRELHKHQLNEPKSDEIFNYIYVNIFIPKLLPCLSQCSYCLSGLYRLNMYLSPSTLLSRQSIIQEIFFIETILLN